MFILGDFFEPPNETKMKSIKVYLNKYVNLKSKSVYAQLEAAHEMFHDFVLQSVVAEHLRA